MTRSLALALGLAAAGSLVTFALVLDGPSVGRPIRPAGVDTLSPRSPTATLEPAGELDQVEADTPRAPAPRIAGRTDDRASGRRHVFDVTFVPVDDLGFPVPAVTVELALVGHRMNRLGLSDWKGELHTTWTGALPELDAFVRLDSGAYVTIESRVFLTAGAPTTVRIGHSGPSSDRPPRSQERQVLYDGSYEADPYGVHLLQEQPPWLVQGIDDHDAFVDQDLLARIWAVDEPGRMSGCGFGCSFGGSSNQEATVTVRVKDEDGRALPGVQCVVYSPGGKHEPGSTDDQGRFEIRRLGPTRAEIMVGGRDREIASRSFRFDVPTETWDVELKPVPVVRGRLLGADDAPLGEWVVEAHDADGRAGFLASARTDTQGEFVLGIQHGSCVELRARPSSIPWTPAVLLAARHVLGSKPDTVFVVPKSAPASASWRIELPVDVEGMVPHSRLVRLDTGETAGVGPCKREVVNGRTQRFTFRAADLLAGDYALEILAAGCAPGGSARVRISGDDDLGAFDLVAGARIELLEGPDMSLVTAVTTVQGMQVRSEIMSLPNRFVLAPGEHELCFSRRTHEPENASFVRRVHVAAGKMIDLEPQR